MKCGIGIVGTDVVQSTSHPTIIPSELSPGQFHLIGIFLSTLAILSKSNLLPDRCKSQPMTLSKKHWPPIDNMPTKCNTFHRIRFSLDLQPIFWICPCKSIYKLICIYALHCRHPELRRNSKPTCLHALTGVGMSGGLGDGPVGVALGQVAPDDDLLPLVLEGLGHRTAGYRPRLVEGLRIRFAFGWIHDTCMGDGKEGM